jgi:type III restriction enzyme
MADGTMVVLEIKGRSHEDTDAKHQAARRWVSAVNNWGKLGRWDFLVCRDPQQLPLMLRAYEPKALSQ